MANVTCMYCGHISSSVSSLSSGTCSKNPFSKNHQLYEGSQKSQYVCKYCGHKMSTIASLTSGTCSKNPNGKRHVPAL